MAEERVGPKNHEAEPKVTMINLSEVDARRKNVLEASITIGWREYTASTTALAVPLFLQASKGAGLNNNRPPAFEVGLIEGKPGTVALFPRDVQSEQYVKATWHDSGSRCRLDFQKLMALLKFSIPANTNAVIPIKLGTYGKKACIEVYFNQAEFSPVEERKSKKSTKASAETAKAGAQAKEQAAPAQEPAKAPGAPAEKAQ